MVKGVKVVPVKAKIVGVFACVGDESHAIERMHETLKAPSQLRGWQRVEGMDCPDDVEGAGWTVKRL